MEAWKCCMLVFGLILVIAVQSGLSIRCYVCNSGYKYAGDDCKDADKVKKSSYLKDCADEEKRDRVANGTYTLCRYFAQDVMGEKRVIRQCASGGRTDKCIERTGTKDIKLQYCQCDFDECNSATSLYAPITMTIGVVAAVVAIAQRT